MRPEPQSSLSPGRFEQSTAEAVIAGHICLDLIPTLVGDIKFEPGALVTAGEAVTAAGGVVANTGAALLRLGVHTRMVGKVADDLFGHALRTRLEGLGAGLSSSLICAREGCTSYTIVLSAPGRDRMFIHAPGCNDTFAAADLDDAVFEQARLFHFGYPPLMKAMCRDNGADLSAVFRRAKTAGMTTSLDLCMPATNDACDGTNWKRLLENALPNVDIIMPNIEELLCMLRPEQYRSLMSAGGRDGILSAHSLLTIAVDLADEILDMGARVVGVKCGHFGLCVRTSSPLALSRMGRATPAYPDNWGNRELLSPCYQARLVGTTGAGDATVAGFLMGLLRGMPIEQAANAACAVGAFSVEAADAHSGIRNWEVTSARMRAGWERLPAPAGGYAWRWNEPLAVWHGPRDASTVGKQC